ncbi:MAG: hypothetical protein FJ224_07570 [Lentisphaerae bacterium]|nr:hypothetical protein [Lentisphaerota bacterium]
MKQSRAAWMRDGKFGMMVHWIPPGPPPQYGRRLKDINKAVDRFDLDRFLADFRRSGADWLIFTIGQNNGYYSSPNSVLDRLAGPGHCSNRDLVLEIAKGVKKMGARFIAYLPCEVKGQSDAIHQAFGWTTDEGTGQEEFQRRYTEFIAEYSRRLGKRLDGWWFDGAYTWSIFHSSKISSKLYMNAARAGNPDAAVAFNDGSFCCGLGKPVVRGQDYLSGEVEFLINGRIRYGRKKRLLRPTTHTPQPPRTCLWHALVPIDCMWGHGATYADWMNAPFPCVPPKPHEMEAPLYTVEHLEKLVREFKAMGGGVTFNVGIFQEGILGTKTLDQLAQLAGRMV